MIYPARLNEPVFAAKLFGSACDQCVENMLHTCIWLPDGRLRLPPKERCRLNGSSYITDSPYLDSKGKQVVSDQYSVSFPSHNTMPSLLM